MRTTSLRQTTQPLPTNVENLTESSHWWSVWKIRAIVVLSVVVTQGCGNASGEADDAFQRAVKYESTQDFESAIIELTMSIRLNPNNPAYY